MTTLSSEDCAELHDVMQSLPPKTRALWNRWEQIKNERLLEMLTQMADSHDIGGNHSQRIGAYTRLLMEKAGFSIEEKDTCQQIARIHDIGMIAISDDILHKRDQLSDEERCLLAQHTIIGAEWIKSLDYPYMSEATIILRHHHENYDGSGYPDHLAHDRIPLYARMVRIADAFDAMTTSRPYRHNPFTIDQAAQELQVKAGIWFDPAKVGLFCNNLDAVKAIHTELA